MDSFLTDVTHKGGNVGLGLGAHLPGATRVNDMAVTPRTMFGDAVYTRELTRGGTVARLVPEGTPTPRKSHTYGVMVGPALRATHPWTLAFFLVGDSLTSDGAVVAGLRFAGIKTVFFCGRPARHGPEDHPIWTDEDTATGPWAAAGGVAARHRWVFNPTTILAVDLDNTFWTPAGLNEAAAARVRRKAVLGLLGRNVTRVEQSRRHCLEALELAEAAELASMVADDEERKAFIALVGAMMVDGGGAPGHFRTTNEFARFLRCIVDQEADPFTRFLRVGLEITEAKAWLIGEGTWTALYGDLQTAIARLEAGEVTLFPNFRELQRELSIDQADPAVLPSERFMANRAVVELIRLAKAGGCPVVALTDRPSLAIFPEARRGLKGRSLWDTPLILTGPGLNRPP
jgi:hypothetical protein